MSTTSSPSVTRASTSGESRGGFVGSGIAFTSDTNLDRQTYWLTAQQLNSTVISVTNSLGFITNISPYTQHSLNIGVFGVNSNTGINEISDGTSNVILVAERRIFLTKFPNQRRSSDGWAKGGPATLFSTRLVPNPPPTGQRDGVHFDEAGSLHPQGLNYLSADGSVHLPPLRYGWRSRYSPSSDRTVGVRNISPPKKPSSPKACMYEL